MRIKRDFFFRELERTFPPRPSGFGLHPWPPRLEPNHYMVSEVGDFLPAVCNGF